MGVFSLRRFAFERVQDTFGKQDSGLENSRGGALLLSPTSRAVRHLTDCKC